MKIPYLGKRDENKPCWGNGKKTLKSQRNRQQFQTCLIWWFVKCAPKKTYPKPTRGGLKCDKPTQSTKIHVMKHNTRVDSNNEKRDLSTWSIEYCYYQSYPTLRTNCWLHFQIANFKKFPATKQQRPTSPWWQCQPLYLVAGLFLFKKTYPSKGEKYPYEMRPVGPAFGCSTQVGCILTTPNQFIGSLLSNIFLKIQEILGKYKHHSQGMIRRLGKGYNSTHSISVFADKQTQMNLDQKNQRQIHSMVL